MLYRSRSFRCSALLATVAACTPVPPDSNVSAVVQLAQTAISQDCEAAAAQRLGLPRAEVEIRRIRTERDSLSAIGQWPADAAARVRFECRYDKDGVLSAVERL